MVTTTDLQTVTRIFESPMRIKVIDTLRRRDVLDPGEVATTDAERIALHHLHLPMLAEHGAIDWDPGMDTIARGDDYAKFTDALERFEMSQPARAAP